MRDPAEEIVRYPAKFLICPHLTRICSGERNYGTNWVNSGVKFRALTPFAQNLTPFYVARALIRPLFTNHGLKDDQDESDFL